MSCLLYESNKHRTHEYADSYMHSNNLSRYGAVLTCLCSALIIIKTDCIYTVQGCVKEHLLCRWVPSTL